MTIIATADVHLGMKFSSYPERQTALTEERFRALERVVAAGNERRADALVVAGDLFHRVGVAHSVIHRAAGILAAFEGAVTLVLPGNHDYLPSEGDELWTRFREAAGDRTLVLDRAGAFDLDVYDLPARVLAAPCDAVHGASHRLGWAHDAPADDRLVVGVAHGSIDGLTLDAEGHYFPMTSRMLGSLPADLWIVGHTHRSHVLEQERVVVPGTPEADGFDCPVRGVAALVTTETPAAPADDREPQRALRDPARGEAIPFSVDFLPVGRHLFHEARVTLEDPRGELADAELEERVTSVLPAGEVLARVRVSGMLADEAFRRWNAVRARLLEDDRLVRLDDDDLRRVLSRADVDRLYAAGS
ncbi:MAG: exonuclease SbcCD subunit D, partial [Spirochaetales bacterium]